MTKVNMISKTKEQKSISVTDEFSFADNGEIRDFFNRNGKCQKAFYIINRENKDHLWLPHLSIKKDNRIIPATKAGHFNIYENENTILECVNYDKVKKWEKTNEEEREKLDKEIEQFKRITFAKFHNNSGEYYRFIGVFHKTGEIINKEINGELKRFRIHKKVADEISIDMKYTIIA